MKVLVIGGTRYFGKRLVHLLLDEGHEVTTLTRGITKDDFESRIQRIHVDRTNPQVFLKSVTHENFDIVVDQFCMTKVDAETAVKAFAGKVTYYLMTSTLSVYSYGADLRESQFNALTYQPGSDNPYAEGKRAAEKVFQSQSIMKCGFARFPIVLGTDDWTERFSGTILDVQNETPLSFPNPEAKLSFITSKDAARALLWMIQHQHQGPFNFSAQDPFSIKELLKLIEEECGKKAIISKEGKSSPFGVEKDFYQNSKKAEKAGFKCLDHSQWLRPLIRYYLNKN